MISERRHLVPGTRRRPADVFVCLWRGTGDGWVDTTVINPFADMWAALAVSKPGAGVAKCEANKRRKAEGFALASGAVYLPFGANASLGFGPSAVQCMRLRMHCARGKVAKWAISSAGSAMLCPRRLSGAIAFCWSQLASFSA